MPFTPHSKKINREVANFSYKQRPVVCFELLAFLIYQASPLPQRLSTAQRAKSLGQMTWELRARGTFLSLAAWAQAGEACSGRKAMTLAFRTHLAPDKVNKRQSWEVAL